MRLLCSYPTAKPLKSTSKRGDALALIGEGTFLYLPRRHIPVYCPTHA